MKQRMKFAGLSDKGRVRKENEDNWTADPKQGLFIVSDGLGGQVAGALASRIVVQTLPGLVRKALVDVKDLGNPNASERLLEAISQLSLEVRRNTKGEPGLEGMGATVVLSLIRESKTLIAHMGDSRAYLFRNGNLTQLTKDHSIVQLLVDNGEISQEEVRSHPSRGRVTRSVGMVGEPLPEARLLELWPGDRLFLCTDGLVGMLDDTEILRILRRGKRPNDICRSLVDSANEAGGQDNVTVLVIAPALDSGTGSS